MRGGMVCLVALACFVELGRDNMAPWALAVPDTARPKALTGRGHLRCMPRVSITGTIERRARVAARQVAQPHRTMGGSATSPGRRSTPSHRRKTRRRASFTDLVMEIVGSPVLLLIEIAVVVVLSGFFEVWERKARRRLDVAGHETGAQILNALFKEITTLGFVAFVIFLATHTGAADRLAPLVFRDNRINVHGHNPLAATFETVHMMIFMLLVVLLAQAAAMSVTSEQITDRWGCYEQTVASGSGAQTLETLLVHAGYLRRVRDPEAPEGRGLEQAKRFSYGRTVWQRLLLRSRPLHKLIMWRAIRHEFLFPSMTVGGRGLRMVPDASLFCFEEYLRRRMGKVVLSLIHVNRQMWLATLLLLTVPLFLCRRFGWMPAAVHCALAWLLGLAGVIMSLLLERDTFRLTPSVPEDGRGIVRLFSGESFQQLRREKLPGWRGRPGLAEGEQAPLALGLPPAILQASEQAGKLSSQGFKDWFRMLSFLQAVSVTSLILSHLSSPVSGTLEAALYFAAWAEWPFMLFVIVPVIVRRLTLRSSIMYEKDTELILSVTNESKRSLVRDFRRLVQLIGFEARSTKAREPWTLRGEGPWPRQQAIQMLLAGARKFDGMLPLEKREIWRLFAAWDGCAHGVVETRELVEAFRFMGSPAAQEAVQNLINAVDFDQTGSLDWIKFKALLGLATADRPTVELRDDLQGAFEFMDMDASGDLTIFELAKAFQRMRIGIGFDELANLLFCHFGMAKPSLDADEFAEWILADLAVVNRAPASY